MASLSEAGHARIEATIAELELQTAAELVVLTTPRSADYSEVKLGYALALSLATGSLAHELLPAWWSTTWLLWLQLAAAAFALALTSIPALLRLCVPKALQQHKVEQRARLAFLDHELFATRDRTGVLILLSELEHRVVILGDSGIHAKIQPAGWQEHVDRLVQAIRAGRADDGVCETLRAIGATLIAEFPVRDDDRNELPNTVRRDPR